MSDDRLNPISAESGPPFERIRQVDSDGNEFWSARDLMPVLEYTNWQNFHSAIQDAFTALSLYNPHQTDIVQSRRNVEIGSGAVRSIIDWRLSAHGLQSVLRRVASSKSIAAYELWQRHLGQMRVELEIGAILYAFCLEAGLSLKGQHRIENRFFDFLIADRVLIEIDENHHRNNPAQTEIDARKNDIARLAGYELLRIIPPVSNAAQLCGAVTARLLGTHHSIALTVVPLYRTGSRCPVRR